MLMATIIEGATNQKVNEKLTDDNSWPHVFRRLFYVYVISTL